MALGLGIPGATLPFLAAKNPALPWVQHRDGQSRSAQTSIGVGLAQHTALGRGALCHRSLWLPELLAPWVAKDLVIWRCTLHWRSHPAAGLVLAGSFASPSPGWGEGRDPRFGAVAPWIVGLCLPEVALGCLTVLQEGLWMDSFPH